MSRRVAGVALTMVATFIIAGLTLTTGRTTGGPRIDMWCLACGDAGVTNLLLNLVLFLPLGAGLALSGWPRWRSVLFGFGLSLVVEFMQLTILPGRFATLADLVSNTAGTWLGHLLTAAALDGRRPSRPALIVRVVVVWFGAILVPLAAGVAFRLSPGSGNIPWYGQWANVLEGLDPFGGTVLDVRLNGTPIPPERLDHRERLRTMWRADELRFEARVQTGSIPVRRALVATIAEDLIGWPAAIWQDGRDATMSLRLGAADLRVRSPAIRLTDGLAYPAGTEVFLTIRYRGGILTATSEANGIRRETALPLRVSSAWKTMWPFGSDYRSETRARNLAWVAGFSLLTGALLGAWSQRGGALLLGALLAASIPPIMHWIVPLMSGLAPSTLFEWTASIGGMALGFGAGAGIVWRVARGVAAAQPGASAR